MTQSGKVSDVFIPHCTGNTSMLITNSFFLFLFHNSKLLRQLTDSAPIGFISEAVDDQTDTSAIK